MNKFFLHAENIDAKTRRFPYFFARAKNVVMCNVDFSLAQEHLTYDLFGETIEAEGEEISLNMKGIQALINILRRKDSDGSMFAKIPQFRVGKSRATMLLVTCAALFLWGCSGSTFLVSKDCTTYFLGDTEAVFNKMLCASGDFKKILESSNLPQDIRDSLYQAQCVDHSREDVRKIYASLTPEQKRDLKFNFQVHGYYVNYKPVPNYQYNYYAVYNREFCPPEKEY